MKAIFSLMVLLLSSNLAFAQAKQNNTLATEQIKLTTVVIGIEGMACQEGCADKISQNLQNTTGVTAAVVSYENKEAVIKFNSELINPLQLKRVITETKVKDYIYTINAIAIKE